VTGASTLDMLGKFWGGEKTFFLLTSKEPWLCSHQKCSKTVIFRTITKFCKNNFFLTHVTVGSCSVLTCEHVVKISEIFTAWIARYKHSNSPNPFFWPCKKQGSSTWQAHFSMKKCPKWWYFFGFFFLDKLATCIKNITSFGIWNYRTYRKEKK